MFNLVKDDFDENMNDIMNSINKLLINDKAHESFYKSFGMKEYIKDNR